MVCSSCGYDSPREHRYCGMCGTPFPHRDLTVPDAQSTLAFTSVPLEVTPSTLSVTAVEVQHPPVESRTVEAERQRADSLEIPAEPIAPEAEVREPQAIVADAVAEGVKYQPPAPHAVEFEPPRPANEPVAAGPVAAAEAAPVELVTPEPPAEFTESMAALPVEEAAQHPTVEEPIAVEAESTPALVEPPALEVEAPVPPRAFASRTSEAPPPREEAPPVEVRKPVPFIVPRPASPRREVPPADRDTGPGQPRVVKPPIPEPFTPPPASAGMPTFKEVSEASGAPDISPFEPPIEKHPDEDRELKEYIANFRYTPPSETADELTMRSEVPKIDREAPAEFHHASFDGDVPPPPEAGAHPTGEEYYPTGSAAATRSRFLDISEAPAPTPRAQPEAHAGTSFLGLDDSAAAAQPLEEAAAPVRRRWGLWSSLVALLLIFGALGYLEGRAQSTHAFRGPVEIVRDGYEKLRQRIVELRAPVPPADENPSTRAETQPEQPEKPAASEQAPAAKPQPDNSAESVGPAASAAGAAPAASPTGEPAAQPSQAQQTPPATPPAVDAKAPGETQAEAANTEPAKPIEVPAAKPPANPQPGQQELAKAMDASDPAAAAAWLWKATSRGNPVAPVRLADMYIKGQGVPRSCEQALVLLRSAATRENAPARNRLASLYANGTCVARDRVRAYQLMSSALAADPTSEWAEQNRQALWNQMTAEERAEAQKYR